MQEVAEPKIINWDLLPGLSKRNAFWFPFDAGIYNNMLKLTGYIKPKSIGQWVSLNITTLPKVLVRMLSAWKVDKG